MNKILIKIIIFIQENWFKNVIYRISAILFQPEYVKQLFLDIECR